MIGISAAGSAAAMQQMHPASFETNTLTDEQRAKVSDILENFDLENMSAEDHESLRTQLKEAGIGPSKDLMEMLKDAGLEPPARGEGGHRPPPSGPPPGPPPGDSSSVDSQKLETVFDILDNYDLENLSDSDKESIQTAFKNAGFDANDKIFDLLV